MKKRFAVAALSAVCFASSVYADGCSCNCQGTQTEETAEAQPATEAEAQADVQA